MKHLAFTIGILSLIPVLLVGCGKEDNFSAPNPDSTQVTVLVPTCRLNAEGSSATASVKANQFTLYYDNSGNLTSVLGTLSPGTQIITNTTISSNQIQQNLDGKETIVTYDFAQDLFTGRPENYKTVIDDGSSSKNKTVSVAYDASGRPAAVNCLVTKTSAFFNRLDIHYDRGGNTDTLTYTYPNGAKTVYSVSAFDTRHSPYDSMKNAGLLMYNWDFFSSDILYIIQHLSRNNPESYSCVFYTGDTFTATLDYKYSAENYPVQITRTSTNSTGAPIVWNYSYDCQKP